MGMVVRFRHARTSIRAAKLVKTSAVTAFSLARSVERTADHHSAGIVSRCHHFETVDDRAPVASAMASREGHNSITARKDGISLMPSRLGQLVLNCKDNLALDCKLSIGQNGLMSDSGTKAEYNQQFITRVKAARIATGKKQWQVAELMGIKQDEYKHYEVSRVIPHHLIGRFCLICSVDPGWLITNRGPKPLQPPHSVETEEAPIPKPKRAKRSKAA